MILEKRKSTVVGFSVGSIECSSPLPLPLFDLLPQLCCVRSVPLPLSILLAAKHVPVN